MQRVTSGSTSHGYETLKVSLSCLQCQQRKKKCDKKDPCHACSQACIACTPISRARLPRGRHVNQQGNAVLRQRVARLEQLLSPTRKAREIAEPLPPTNNPTTSHSIWNTISEEVVGIRELLDNLTGDEPNDILDETPDTVQTQNFDVLLYGDASCFVQPYVFEPLPREMISELVDIYSYRIDQVFKVIHMPSLHAMLLEVNTRTPAQEALKASILFTAVNSLDELDCQQRFNLSKSSLSSKLQLAVEVQLSRAGLLTTTDLTALQAFVIYLAGLRARHGSRATSALLATAVRIGQSLGLEVEMASRTPFETELRRRTWYSIGILELQAAFDNGSYTSLVGSSFFGPAPLHINDADISPYDLAPVRERSSLTDMTFCCATHEMLRHMRRMIHVPRNTDGRALLQQDWSQRYAIVEDCARSLEEKYLKHCNGADTFQKFTRVVCEGMIVTLRLLVRRPMYRSPISKPPPDDDFNVLDVATDVLDQTYRKAGNDGFRPWQWFAWLKWYALAVVLAELCEHTKGPLVEKAWAIAEITFAKYKEMIHDPILWRSMENLMSKAQSARGFNISAADCGDRLIHNRKMSLRSEVVGTTSCHKDHMFSGTNSYGNSGLQENLWDDVEMLSWVNWESFVQDFGAPIQLDMNNEYQ